jgi:hypothetical protein
MYLSIKNCVITEKHLLSKNVTVIACNIFYIIENGTIFNHKNVSFYEYSASYLVSTLLILMYIALFLGGNNNYNSQDMFHGLQRLLAGTD